jgi:transposase-like protein
VAERLHAGPPREAVLCAWGITDDGQKVLLHLAPGTKEDTASCTSFFEDLKRRGLADPLLVVTDGAAGLIRAVETCFPRALRQRGLVHRLRNLRSKAPESRWPEIALRARGCYEAASPALATVLREDFVQAYARELPAVVQCFTDDFEACIAHLRFPLRHRRVVRTTNLLERLFLEGRRRTKIIPNAFGERPVLKLMYAAVIRAAERWRGSRSANSSSANSARFAKSSAALTLSGWRPPLLRDPRRRCENCELIDERRGARRRIWLQIDDLRVGRYLATPKSHQSARHRVRRPLSYPAPLGLDLRSRSTSRSFLSRN